MQEKKDNDLRYVPTNNKCSAILFSNSNKSIIIKYSGKRNHSQNSERKLQNKTRREDLHTGTRPMKIFWVELLNTFSIDSAAEHRNITIPSVLMEMYETCKNIYPEIPKSLNVAIIQLNYVQNKKNFLFELNKLIIMPNNE